MKKATTQEQVIRRLLSLCLVLVAMVIASLVGLIVINNAQSRNRDAKIQEILEQHNRESVATHADAETIKNRMACLGTFLSRNNREQLTITNFDTCTFENKETGETGTLPVQEVFSPQPQTQSPQTNNQNPQGGGNGQGNQPANQPPPPDNRNVIERAGDALGSLIDRVF